MVFSISNPFFCFLFLFVFQPFHAVVAEDGLFRRPFSTHKRPVVFSCRDLVLKSKCSQNSKCRWCTSQVLDDTCFDKSEALRLPHQVFSCSDSDAEKNNSSKSKAEATTSSSPYHHNPSELAFEDVTIEKPIESSEENHVWEKADSMATTWIINSTDTSLHNNCLDGEDRFAQTDALRVHQLWRTLSLIQQESKMTVTEYYIRFKRIADELSEQQSLLEWKCGAAKQIMQREEDSLVRLFLSGLDEYLYTDIKRTIVNMDPLPSLKETFNYVLREEVRINADKIREVKQQKSSGFHSFKQKSSDGIRTECDDCETIGLQDGSEFFD
ncbi:uncharacterized protein LOC131607878 [Vicia villosa]|uniref:uncharacterized protein LOC131607878 n=1 Tax=Vicia villosa TaxID=3911 RepID=UPI00273CB722|nr:uncharacterized protein LOC131607878 [Vicia villosa]